MVEPYKLFGRLGNQMFQMAYIVSQASKGAISDIYLQDPKYFQDCEQEVKAMFGTHIEPSEYVSIHVRRGDYVNNPFYVDLTQSSYYKDAMNKFPTMKFLIFSDEINWCKSRFIGEEYEFCEEKDPIKAMNLMAGCKHNIIANSSFSWWAAYLNPNPNKIVVAPKAWYADRVERTKCPPSWQRI